MAEAAAARHEQCRPQILDGPSDSGEGLAEGVALEVDTAFKD